MLLQETLLHVTPSARAHVYPAALPPTARAALLFAELRNMAAHDKSSNTINNVNSLEKCIVCHEAFRLQRHSWSSGRIGPCHGPDPGSIPGECMLFCLASHRK